MKAPSKNGAAKSPVRRVRSNRLLIETLEDRLPPGDALGALLAWSYVSAASLNASGIVEATRAESEAMSTLGKPAIHISHGPMALTQVPWKVNATPGLESVDASKGEPQIQPAQELAHHHNDAVFSTDWDPLPDRALMVSSSSAGFAAEHPSAPAPTDTSHGVSFIVVPGVESTPGAPSVSAPSTTAWQPTIGSEVQVRALLPVIPKNLQVHVQQIQFGGPNNVPIVIDGNTLIGTPGGGPGSPDVQWVRGLRDNRNTTKGWTTTQSAPAAFLEGAPLQADVTFTVSDPNVTSITVSADNSGVYGGIMQTDVAIHAGIGTATFMTDPANAVRTVNVNDVLFQWRLQAITVAGMNLQVNQTLEQTFHRIYTLKAAPVAPMARPWAKVLELSCGIDKRLSGGKDDPTAIVTAETRGEYTSAWMSFAFATHFLALNPLATLVYDPALTRTLFPAGLSDFSNQLYGLNGFLAALQMRFNLQQCNDNANLLAVFLDSLGVPMQPLAILPALKPVLQRTAPYFPAGPVPSRTDVFTFHQVGFFNDRVYDPSTAPTRGGPPFMGMTLTNYINTVFPGQNDPGPVGGGGVNTVLVTTLNVGDVTLSGLKVASASPRAGRRGMTTTVAVIGFPFDSSTRVFAVEKGTTTPALGVTISNVMVSSTIRLTFDLRPSIATPPRMIDIYVVRSGVEGSGRDRFTFTIWAPH
jgi:hypothetical protein